MGTNITYWAERSRVNVILNACLPTDYVINEHQKARCIELPFGMAGIFLDLVVVTIAGQKGNQFKCSPGEKHV